MRTFILSMTVWKPVKHLSGREAPWQHFTMKKGMYRKGYGVYRIAQSFYIQIGVVSIKPGRREKHQFMRTVIEVYSFQ